MTDAIDRAEAAGAKSAQGWILASGIGFVLIGVAAFLQPVAAASEAGKFIAVSLIAGGIVAILVWASDRGRRHRWLYAALGLLSVGAGAVVLVAAPVAVFAVGLWLLASGILELVAGLRAGHGRVWLILVAIADLVLGLTALLAPALAFLFLATVVGASFVYRGLATILYALRRGGISRHRPGGPLPG